MKNHKDSDVKVPPSNVVKPTEVEARKKCYNKGGHVMDEERKHGGKANHEHMGHKPKRKHGGKASHEHDEEHKHGGKATHEKKQMHHLEGEKAHGRLDRPARKSGGSVGADKHPFTTAATITSRASASR